MSYSSRNEGLAEGREHQRLRLWRWALPAVSLIVPALAGLAAYGVFADAERDTRSREYGALLKGLAETMDARGVSASDLSSGMTGFEGVSPFVEEGVDEDRARELFSQSTSKTVFHRLSSGEILGVTLDPLGHPELLGAIAALVLMGAALGSLLALKLKAADRAGFAVRAALVKGLAEGGDEPEKQGKDGNFFEPLDRTASELRGMISEKEQRDSSHHELSGEQARVFASMSHDLRSPLNSIIGFADLLSRGIDGQLNEAQDRTVKEIAEQSERLLVLIGDILDTAKINAGRFELDRSWAPLVDIMRDVDTGVRRGTASKQVELEWRLEPGLPPIFVDKERLARSILSLVVRILEDVKEGSVLIEASRITDGLDTPRLLLRLTEVNGCMSEVGRADFRQVFEGGERSFKTGARADMVLGFSLAKKVVAMHGGTVVLEDGEDGELVVSFSLGLDDGEREE